MSMTAIEEYMREVAGLSANSSGKVAVSRVVRARMSILSIDKVQDYYDRIRSDFMERQALIDDITVPETWFFRDRAPFKYLAEYVRKEWMDKAGEEAVLRVLSLPCATGEEAYSIAIVLKESGIRRQRLRIDGYDISTKALGNAQAGIYKRNSFRGDHDPHHMGYFTKEGEHYRLQEPIRSMVSFQHGSLLDEKIFRGQQYDIVFCRNLLIYFDKETQDQAVANLAALMPDNGLLFVGHAESGCLTGKQFTSIKHSNTFAFRKSRVDEGLDREVNTVQMKSNISPERAHIPSARGDAPSCGSPVNEITHLPVDNQLLPGAFSIEDDRHHILNEMKKLADQGDLSDAASRLEEYLRSYPVCPEAFYLLGVIREAEGFAELAGDLFRKAVYLDPRHYQALVHLAAQAELRGDDEAARTYRTRASRAAENGS